jgi:hypothetical protein
MQQSKSVTASLARLKKTRGAVRSLAGTLCASQ